MSTVYIPANDSAANISMDMRKLTKRLHAAFIAKCAQAAPAGIQPPDSPNAGQRVDAAGCAVPGCVESARDHTADSMHVSAVEQLHAADKTFGPLASINYTRDEGKAGFYLEWAPGPVEGTLTDLSALADALRDMAAQMDARAKTSPLHTGEA